MPHNIYANMPLGAEMHVLNGMMSWHAITGDREAAWWWGALAGKVILAWFVIANAILVRACARRLLQRYGRSCDRNWVADWSMVVAIATPALLEGGSLGLVEAVLAAYLAMGMLLVVSTSRATCPSQVAQCVGMIALIGGAMIGVKYPAVVLIVPFLMAAPFLVVEEKGIWNQVGKPRLAMVVGVAMILGGATWYAKNWALSGNPVYPLLGQWLGGATLTPEKIAQWNAAHEVPGYTAGQLYASIANGIWKWRLQSWSLLPLFCVGLLGGKRDRVMWVACGGFIFYLLGWWFLTHRIERFLIPAMPLAMLFGACGISQLRSIINRRWLGVILGCLVVFDAYYAMRATMGDSRILVDLLYLRRDDLSQSSISRLPQHVPFINQQLPTEAKLLVVGDAAVFDYERELDYSTTFDQSPLIGLVGESDAGVVERFRNSGYSHLVVHWGEIERLRNSYGFDERINRELISRLQQTGALKPQPITLLEGRVEIYELVVSEF